MRIGGRFGFIHRHNLLPAALFLLVFSAFSSDSDLKSCSAVVSVIESGTRDDSGLKLSEVPVTLNSLDWIVADRKTKSSDGLFRFLNVRGGHSYEVRIAERIEIKGESYVLAHPERKAVRISVPTCHFKVIIPDYIYRKSP